MSEYFDMIKEGLEEAIEYERGNKSVARSTKIYIKPIPEYTNIDIKNIRNELQLTQQAFADLVGVSKKTVEAWECGTRKPTGSAKRLMQIVINNRGIEKQIINIQH
ncbi:MAG TPA: helix-turn-helix domain-containing protein [Clostridiaceae bacterium]|jgi:putative transcriptional regulator|nr:helix-turn-helix domain-containing protein [Clostridiaceae bacterium]